jgi:hypothetical protein
MTSQEYIYINIDDNIEYKGYKTFYKVPIDTINKQKSTIFNDKYIYYLKTECSNSNEEEYKLLGKFERIGKVNLGCPYNDYDYDVYVFEKDKVFCTKKDFIYSVGIPDSNENMFLIEDMTYNGCPMYYNEIMVLIKDMTHNDCLMYKNE